MTESFEHNSSTENEEIIHNFKGELDALSLEIKKECFNAEQKLKNEVKRLGFYNGEEKGENIKFNINKVKTYLEGIKNKSRSDLEVKASELEKGVWTIAIQIAINYINKSNGKSTDNIDWIDGIRGNKTWKGVKEFQTTYNLKNKDGLPGHETITKILELIKNDNTQGEQWNNKQNLEDNDYKSGDHEDKGYSKNKDNTESFRNNRLNGNNIDNRRYTNLLRNLKIYRENNDENNFLIRNNGFENRLKEKIKNKGEIEGIIFNNPEIQKFLNTIINKEGQDIQIMKQRYLTKTENENKNLNEKDKTIDNNEEIVESWEEYKFNNFSQESFDEFILSDEGISIIIEEVKSHIDTSHINENGEYDKFYEKYPISIKSLEIKLKNAWESKMQRDYYTKNGIYDEEKKEEIEKLDVISNQITGYVDKIVGEYMKIGNEDFNQNIIQSLEGLLNKGYNNIPFNELFSDQNHKDTFKVVLADKIKKYGIFVRDGNNINLNTGDKQINLQLKSYLYIYGSIFYSEYFKANKDTQYYDEILPEIMKSILSNDDISLIDKIKHTEFLKAEKKLEENRKKRDEQRRKNVAKRNRENGKIYGKGKRSFNGNTGNKDINGATGAQIVQHSGVNLSDFEINNGNTEAFTKSGFAKEKALGITWKKFTESYKEIDDVITPEDMHNLYNIETNSINEDSRKEFVESEAMQGKSSEEINRIYKIIKSFPNEFSNTLKAIASGAEIQGNKIDEATRNHALGSVIDNVRFIFADIVEKRKGNSKFEGFKFDGSEPVKREGNDIIISGVFNGTPIKIRYDLISGGLFMNSFLHQTYIPPKITIGNNDNTNILIGQLESFDKILDEHYRIPDISFHSTPHNQNGGAQIHSNQSSGNNQGGYYGEISNGSNNNIGNSTINENRLFNGIIQNNTSKIISSEHKTFKPGTSEIGNTKKIEFEIIRKKYRDMLYANLDMISDNIISKTKEQHIKNSLINKFMKTFNIITDNQENKNIEFNDGSNLFNLLQIIDNSDSETLEKFQIFMEKISDYSGLAWGNNNFYGSQKNSKYNITFNENNKNKYISMVRENAKSFSKNPKIFNNKLNYDSDSQLGFAQMIIENITNNVSKPNWKLDQFKMNDFIKHLETDNKDY